MNPLFKGIYTTSLRDVYHFLSLKRRNARAKHIVANYVELHKVRKLHIGCGGNNLTGWLNSDLYPQGYEIAFIDASRTFPIQSGSFDYVYSEHVFEHLTLSQQINYLREAFRILKPGGKIRIATPDFDFLMHLNGDDKSETEREYLKWNFATFLKDVGLQLKDVNDLEVYVINNYFRDWGHQLIHNKSSIRHLVEQTGFEFLQFEPVGKSADPHFAGLEYHGAMITDEYNKLETMVIEAGKPLISKAES